jgi:hypothetical protein
MALFLYPTFHLPAEELQKARSAEQQGRMKEAYTLYTRALEVLNVEIQCSSSNESTQQLVSQVS